MTKSQRTAHFYTAMDRLGFTHDEADKLRRIEMTLHRWAEAECNGEIQRDGEESDGKPRRYYGESMDRSYPTSDREAGALRRLGSIMEAHPELVSYHQTDPRGCALYILRRSELNAHKLNECYTRGFGVSI